MTDNEIIKAFDCCLKSKSLSECKSLDCPAYGEKGCIYFNRSEIDDNSAFFIEMGIDFVAIIKRQQAENEELQSEITLLKESNANLQELYQGEKEKVAKAKQKVIDIAKALKTAKADAIKEMANRLKENDFFKYFTYHGEAALNIDIVAAEMVGDSNG